MSGESLFADAGRWVLREYNALALVQFSKPTVLDQLMGIEHPESPISIDEAYRIIDNASYGPKLSQSMPEHLWPENEWWWLPEEYGVSDWPDA